MSFLTTKNTLILLFVVAVSVVAFLTLGKGNNKKTMASFYESQSLEDILKQREDWRAQINKVGAENFWTDLKENYKTNYHRHSVAHIFGELLYEVKGAGGIAVCDESFFWGCYHALFTKAISDKGLSILSDLDKACFEKTGLVDSGCQHGIGHGLLQYFGSQELPRALESCETLSSKGENCLLGVFMEYNFPTDVSGVVASERIRKLDDSDPYEPCFEMPERFRDACFFELPRLWDRVFASDLEKIGELCSAIKEIGYQEKCFLSIGDAVSLATEHKVNETISDCKKMPDKNGEELCRIAASWGFLSSDNHKNDAFKVCEGLGTEIEAKCAKENK